MRIRNGFNGTMVVISALAALYVAGSGGTVEKHHQGAAPSPHHTH